MYRMPYTYGQVLAALRRAGVPLQAAKLRAQRVLDRRFLPLDDYGQESVEWLKEDSARRSRHYTLWQTWQNDATVLEDSGAFGGHYGAVLETALRGRYDGGDKGERWPAFRQITPFWLHFQHRMADATACVRDSAQQMTGGVADAEIWPELRRQSDLDAILRTVEVEAFGLGAVGLRVEMRPGQAPRLCRLFPHQISTWAAGAVLVVHGAARITIYDLREPFWPEVRVYKGGLRTALYNSEPDRHLYGPGYPLHDDGGRGLCPVILYRGHMGAELLPCPFSLAHSTLDFVDALRLRELIGRHGAYARVFILGAVEDVAAAPIEPAAVIALKVKSDRAGGEAAHVDTVDEMSEAVLNRTDSLASDIATAAGQYGVGYMVERSTGEAESGYAITLRQEGKRRRRRMMGLEWGQADARLAQALAAMWNAQVMRGLTEGSPITTEPPMVSFPSVSDDAEWRELEERLAQDIDEDRQVGNEIDLYLTRRRMDVEDPEARAKAMEALLSRQRERRKLADTGGGDASKA